MIALPKPPNPSTPALRAAYFVLTTALASAALATPSAAQSGRPVGVGVIWMPKFEGSDDYQTLPVPIGGFRWRNVSLDNGALKMTLADVSGGRFGLVASYRPGREEKDAPELRGIGDVDDAVDLGGFAQLNLGAISLEARATYDVAGEGGTSAVTTAAYRAQMTPRTMFIPSIRASWADGDYMNAVFGLSDRQSAASGLEAYSPGSGLKDLGAAFTVVHALTNRWVLTGSTGYTRLSDKAADSPIVREAGSRDQRYAILGATYSF